MQIQLAIYTLADVLIADWSTRVRACTVRTGAHGYESCEADLALPFYEAFNYYQQLGPLKLKVVWGSYRVWEGRLEDPSQFAGTVSGLKITALGGWVAYNDAPIVALWSASRYDGWREITDTDTAGSISQRFEVDTSNRLYMAARKGESFDNAHLGMIGYVTPHLGARQITGISFDYEFKAPSATWELRVDRRDSAWGFTANDITVVGNGLVKTGTRSYVMTATDNITVGMYYNGVAVVFAGETGDCYFKITNVRLVTTVTNRIDTTLTVNRAAGTNVTATVGSTTRMFVGQRLNVTNPAGTVGESVLVLSIGGATTFNATFVNGYVIGDIVRAHIVYPDEIIKDCVATLNTLNPTQVASGVDLIQNQAIDLDQVIYEDEYPAEIINQLLAKSDNQTPPRQWVALVYDDRQLIVRPRGSGVSWYADVNTLEVVRTLTQLYNSVYGVYSDAANKRNLRTAVNTDAASVLKFQITRRKAIQIDTSDSTQATNIRDSVLALQLDPIPRASIKLDRIFDEYGFPYPLFSIRADDTLTIRNLPPVLTSTLYDKIRTLVITRTTVNLLTNTIDLELEIPLPNVSVQLAQAMKAISAVATAVKSKKKPTNVEA